MSESASWRPVIWWVYRAQDPPLRQEVFFVSSSFRFLKFPLALQHLRRDRFPDLLLLQSRPDRDGQKMLTELREWAPRLPILMVNEWKNSGEIQSWLSRSLVTMSQARPADEFEKPNAHRLSRREIEILRLMVKGLIKKEIAEQLAISYHTVDNHERNIFRKLKVHTRSAAVATALIEKIF